MKRILVAFFILGLFLVLGISKCPKSVFGGTCETLNAACSLNSNEKECCPGLTCVDQDSPSGLGKCEESTSPTSSPTISPSPTPTIKPSPTPVESPTPTLTPTPTPTSTSSSTGTGGSSSSGTGVQECKDTKPNTPYLVSTTGGSNSVTLTWQKVLGPVTTYSIEYGSLSKNYIYSALNVGNIDSYSVNGLSRGCFAVRAWNGCMPGDLSNEVCTGVVLGASSQVLGASTMAGTGMFDENIFALIFGMGSVFLGVGVRKIASNKVK